jgi:hypothetical protein
MTLHRAATARSAIVECLPYKARTPASVAE